MKRVLCILFCILLLGGCRTLKTKDLEKEPLNISGFNTVVKTKINNIEICGNASYVVSDALYFDFVSPETINGTKIVCRNGEYEVDFNDLSITLAGDKLPFNMICNALETCINNVQGTTPKIDNITNQLVYTYNTENHLCQLYAEKETKHFIKLTIDGADVLFFENFQYVGQTE
ncbi:MAG: hypothetical protein IKB36_01680 [Clostridia bacterium]|nr:hypothetical protein [Clostridia bacterium]